MPILVGLRKITVRDFPRHQIDGLKDSGTLKQQWTNCTVFSDLDVDGPARRTGTSTARRR